MLNFFGRPSRHRGFFNRAAHSHGHRSAARRGAPLGGLLLPIAGFLAWQNRDKLRAMYDQFAHRTGQGVGTNVPPSPVMP